MAVLKQQAVQILVEAKINSILNSLPCNFSKKVGHVYAVYEKSDGSQYFSMISPEVNFFGSSKVELDGYLRGWMFNSERKKKGYHKRLENCHTSPSFEVRYLRLFLSPLA